MTHLAKVALGAAAIAVLASGAVAGTLDDVKKKGVVACGVNAGLPGFSNPDDKGNWTGLDVDVCRAIAAAVFGDSKKVKFVPTTTANRFTALQSGEVDILSRNTTWTLSRDAALGMEFTGINYYDGQGFMVPTKLKVTTATKLSGATVCVQKGTTTELNLADYFRSTKMQYTIVAFEKLDETIAAYDSGRCDVFTTDRSGLAAVRLKLKNPNDHLVLPEVISKEPLGPAVRHGDNQWGDIARWTLFAMVNAEELGVTSQNVDQMKTSPNPEIKRLLGTEGDLHKGLGLEPNWAYNIIKQVGNYAESYDRNVGPNTPLKLERGVNSLWTKGGLMYAPPIR